MKITPAGAATRFGGPFDAFNAPAPLPPRPDEALPYYGDLQAQRVQTVPVPDAPAPSSGFGLLGGLGGLLGGGQATPSMIEPAPSTGGGGGLFGTGFLDFSDPKTLMAMQLIANGSKAPGQMMDGIAETAAYGQKMRTAAEEKAKEQQQQNRTIAWLQKNRPDLVPLAEAGYVGEAFKMAMQKDKPDLMGVGGAIYNADTGEWITPPEGVGRSEETFFGNPIFIKDPAGNVVPAQMGNRGTLRPLDLGEGNSLAPPTKTINTETHQIVVDNFGNEISRIPINNQQAARDTEVGKAVGQSEGAAIAGLGEAASNVRLIDTMVNDIKNDPDLPRVLGPLDSRTPNISEGAVRVQAKIDQLSGQAFLQARQMLKGGGAITDFESNKAEQAFIRLNQAQSEADFKRALDDFNSAVQEGYRKLSAKVSGAGNMPSTYEAAPAAPSGPTRRRYNPATGELE